MIARHDACSSFGVLARALVLFLVLGLASRASAQAFPTPPPTSHAASSGPADLLWPDAPPAGALHHPILRRGHDMGLISTGIALLSAGMITGVAIASTDLSGGNCRDFTFATGFTGARVSCQNAPLAFVPIAGSILVGSVRFNGSEIDGVMTLVGVVGAVPQILGLVFLLIGMHGFTEDLDEATSSEIAWSLSPILSSTQIGLSLGLTL